MFVFQALQQWHWDQIPDEGKPVLGRQTKGIVALEEDGQLAAACCFDSWTSNACQIHIYIKNPFVLKHGFQQEVFDYAFNTCGKGLVIGATPADNHRALKFIKNIGLEEIYRIKDGSEVGVDTVITELRKENCKWLDQPECLNVMGGN